MSEEPPRPNAEQSQELPAETTTVSQPRVDFSQGWRWVVAFAQRPGGQSVLLFVLSFSINFYQLAHHPRYPHFFEHASVDAYADYKATLDQPWSVILQKYDRWEPGDTDDAGLSLVWALIVHKSAEWFGGEQVRPPSPANVWAYRFPNALICSFIPVLLASFVRRFLRRDMGFIAGVLLATSPLFILLARNAGYDGCTSIIILGLLYCALLIVLESKLWPWLWITVLAALIPYMYSPSRYMWFVVVPVFVYGLIASPVFRARHAWCIPTVLLIQCLLATHHIVTHKGIVRAVQIFYNATGEQIFSYHNPYDYIPERPDGVNYESRWSVAMHALPYRLRQVCNVYWLAQRVSPPIQVGHQDAGYRFWPPWVIPFFGLGIARALYESVRGRWLYGLIVFYSILVWLPQLLTTDINGNRTSMGMPADMMLVALGFVTIADWVNRYVPAKRHWIATAAVHGVVCLAGVLAVRKYVAELHL